MRGRACPNAARIARAAERSFVLCGGGKARETKREETETEREREREREDAELQRGDAERGEESQRRGALASPVTYSPTLIHLFGRRGAQPLGANRRPPTSCVAVSMYAVVVSRSYVGRRAPRAAHTNARASSGSQPRDRGVARSAARCLSLRFRKEEKKNKKKETHARYVTALPNRR